MSAAAVEQPVDPEPREPLTLLDEANKLMEQLPGYRVEIIGGVLTVTPPPDGPHADVLTDLMIPFITAGLHGQETRVIQGIGLWLPNGPDDYAIPDLSIVDADFKEHHRGNNCYDPEVFRLVVEVTSSNHNNDLRNKVVAYAQAMIPVYVIVNRKHGRVHLLTDLADSGYDTHRIYAPGEKITLPDSIGAEVTLDVAAILATGRH
ncbi:Uma2 family endonuclease [Streptomyces sp. ME19-01-6]|uniref:Uma2 family endonuclease n=1 Tax=Streptomyces sp. ME19-01-6 TaxID=3028686 RepID=UPI0029AD2E35|nr:Uma2 family endonuclease [Streptomyces sp. ME19-01-6]MDX3225877.1 Uma2 family endonuclease [Streptomyces sp. ME19-01-6]